MTSWVRSNVLMHRAARLLACLIVAIPVLASNTIDPPAAYAHERSTRGWIGIVMREDKQLAAVFIQSVFHGSPAERAGLVASDRVVSVQGIPTQRPPDVARTVGRLSPGTIAKFVVERQGKRRSADVTIALRPSTEEVMKLDLAGRPAPSWVGLQGVGGTAAPSLAGLRGRVVLIEYWATWCGACAMTSRQLNAWDAKFRGQGLSLIGIAGEAADVVEAGASQGGLRYRVAADPNEETSGAYHVSELPTMVLIDRKGIVRDIAVGYDPARLQALETTIGRLIAEAP